MPSAEPEAQFCPIEDRLRAAAMAAGFVTSFDSFRVARAERLCSVSSAGTIQPPTDRKAAETVGIVTVQSSQSVASGEIETHDVFLAALDSRFASSSLMAFTVSRMFDKLNRSATPDQLAHDGFVVSQF